MLPTAPCRVHYGHVAVAACEVCDAGLCDECLAPGGGRDATLCFECAERRRDANRLLAMRGEDERLLRRHGYAVAGNGPTVLRSGPLRLAVPGAGSLAVALAVGAVATLAQVRVGLDATLVAVFLAALAGYLVRRLFGGVSRTAGVGAAAAAAGGVAAARWFAAGAATATGAPLADLRHHSDAWMANAWTGLAGLLVAALIAYWQGAGHRYS